MNEIRTRFAPSPTGFLHIGSARTALFNYLFAKKNKGTFVLRIEDTDLERSKPEYEKDIIESLKWLGLKWDEGPYRQSERLAIYQKYLEKLLQENKAYYCACTEDELEAQRQDQMSRGLAPKYSGKCSQLGLKEGVIRFRIEPKIVKFLDLIRGEVEFDSGLMGDIVIAKNLKAPLYNFSVVIDDFEMKISHVIRGEEHLSNTPRQILLQEALGIPGLKYAHLPLILAPDRTKLSKRNGSAPVADYRKQGYLAEAIINFLAFLGWNPGGEKEIYSLDQLAEEFNMEKVQKGGAIFNAQRLDYLNGYYIRQKSVKELAELCAPYLPAVLPQVIASYQGRLKKLSEITELADFFFKDDLDYAKDLLKWKQLSDSEIKESLKKSEKILSKINPEDWTKENLEKSLMPEAEKTGDRGVILWPLRAALTGKKASAGPFEVAEALGREKTLKRIKSAINIL